MKLPPITLDVMRHSYELLAACPPFADWNLPPSSEVQFARTRKATVRGRYDSWCDKGHTKNPDKIKRCRISVNPRHIDDFDELLQVMAHEMIHVHEHRAGMRTQADHSEAFLLIARDVCKRYGWRADTFVFGDMPR